MQTAQQHEEPEQKAKAFVAKVEQWHRAQKRAGVEAPGWPLADTDLACEAFELAYALAGVEGD